MVTTIVSESIVKDLISQHKIDGAIAYVQEHAEQIKANNDNFAHCIMHWLARISADDPLFKFINTSTKKDQEQLLGELWAMEALEFDSYIQWLPREVLEDTLPLLSPMDRLISLLVQYGAKLNNKSIYGNYLYWAAKNGNASMMYLLMWHGADINIRNEAGANIFLDQAARYDYESVLERFIVNGANINMQDNDGDTLLHQLVKIDDSRKVCLILKHGADVNAQNRFGISPLHCAAYGKNKYITNLLLENAADINVQDTEGETPLYVAIRNGDESMVKLLLEKGAQANININEDMLTPLHLAAANGLESIVRLLLKHGANVNVRDNLRNLPITYVPPSAQSIRDLLEAAGNAHKESKPVVLNTSSKETKQANPNTSSKETKQANPNTSSKETKQANPNTSSKETKQANPNTSSKETKQANPNTSSKETKQADLNTSSNVNANLNSGSNISSHPNLVYRSLNPSGKNISTTGASKAEPQDKKPSKTDSPDLSPR